MTKHIERYKFKSVAKLQVEVLPLKTLTVKNKHHVITPHRTDFYHIFLFEDCSPTHLVDFLPIRIKPYSLLFVDKDRVHQFDRRLQYDGSVLIFTDDFFCTTDADAQFLHSATVFSDFIGKPNFRVDKSTFTRFKELCNQIREELAFPTDSSTHSILKNLLHNFLLLAEREKRKQGFSEMKKGADLDYALLFKDLLEKNFAGSKHVRFYADALHVSEKKLGRATGKILGKNPKEIINERVVLESKRLLAHSVESVKEIAFELGFEEPTNFIKYFRKHTGKTPVEFRENFLSG